MDRAEFPRGGGSTKKKKNYVFKSLMRKSVDKIMAKGQQAMGTSDVYQMGECNENIENLFKIIEKRKKTLKKHTPPGRRTLQIYIYIYRNKLYT